MLFWIVLISIVQLKGMKIFEKENYIFTRFTNNTKLRRIRSTHKYLFEKKGVDYIVITIEELIPISKKFFENIDHIKPKSVLFHFSKEANKFYGYIKLLQWYNLSSLYFYLQNLNR